MKKRLVTILGSNIALLLAGVVVAGVAWFTVSEKFSPEDVRSSVITSYFDSRNSEYPADGTPDNPFVITKPVHYYNLVNLQKSDKQFGTLDNGDPLYFYNAGYTFEFGKDFDHDGDKEFYEYDDSGVIVEGEYSNYLNMGYYAGENALSPIGSPSHPFMGQIIGNNLTVQNLHITGEGCVDIGIFGYVLDMTIPFDGPHIKNLYFDDIDINVNNVDTSDHNALYHPQTHASCNVGYIAGHVEANNSFENVYINNCKIRNSEAHRAAHNNDYGYFGITTAGSETPIPDGQASHYEFNPNRIYNYLSENYSSIAGNPLRLRNDDYTIRNETVSSSLYYDSSNNAYNLVGTNMAQGTQAHNYSLASIGYEKGAEENNLWYKIGAGYESLSAETILTEDEPGDAPGDYLFYDGEAWNYYICSQTGEDCNKKLWANRAYFCHKKDKPDITKPAWEWYNSGGKYYMGLPNNGGQATFSGSNSNYFAFLTKPGDYNSNVTYQGSGTCKRTDLSGTYYIMNITGGGNASGDYLYIRKGTFRPYFGTFEEAIGPNSLTYKFEISAFVNGVVSCKINNKVYALAFDNSDSSNIRAVPIEEAGNNLAYFGINGASFDADNSHQGGPLFKHDAFELVTSPNDLRDGDVIAIGYGTNPTDGHIEVMTKAQSVNNRKTIFKMMDTFPSEWIPPTWDSQYQTVMRRLQYIPMFLDSDDFAHFTVKKSSNNIFSFYDPVNSGYLYSPSDTYDYLRLCTRYQNELGAQFTISMVPSGTNKGQATITSLANDFHNQLCYDNSKLIFSCYETASGDIVRPYIYKKVADAYVWGYGMQCNEQNQWGHYGGVSSTDFPTYYSQRPATDEVSDDNASRMDISPESLGDWEDVFHFDAVQISLYDSTSIVEMLAGGGQGGGEEGWVKVTDRSDLTEDSEFIIATYSIDADATAGMCDGSSFAPALGSTFANNGRVITQPAVGTTIFTLEGTSSTGYTLKSNGGTLGCDNLGEVNLDGSGLTNWTISFDPGNGSIQMRTENANYGYLRYNFVSENFSTMLSGTGNAIFL